MNKNQVLGFAKDLILGVSAICASYGVISGNINADVISIVGFISTFILSHQKNK